MAAALVFGCAAAYAQGTSVSAIPDTVPPSLRPELLNARVGLVARIVAHNAWVDDFKIRCPPESSATTHPLHPVCSREIQGILKEASTLEVDKTQFNSRVATAATVNNDPSVVDARVVQVGADLVAQVPELARSPAAGLLARGFAEVINHNWPMVLVLWQQVLNNDPANRAIMRSVELAQWNVEYHKRGGREMTTRAARLDAAKTDPVFAEIIGRMERDYKAEADQISAAQDWRIREQLTQEALRFTPR